MVEIPGTAVGQGICASLEIASRAVSEAEVIGAAKDAREIGCVSTSFARRCGRRNR